MISVAMLRIVIVLPNNNGLYLQYLLWTELTLSPVLKGKKKKQVAHDSCFLISDRCMICPLILLHHISRRYN